jgi:hypothetical protein
MDFPPAKVTPFGQSHGSVGWGRFSVLFFCFMHTRLLFMMSH